MERIILHSDLNAFYASVEIMRHPELKGKPVAVCGSVDDRHGIILAKSQEAKIMNVKTGMTLWQARMNCPNLIAVSPHYDSYLHYSKSVHEIYGRYTEFIEPFGIDECWLDVTGCQRLFGSGKDIADALRKTIKSELGLTVSVGVSFNKVFAKLGSDMKKPDGTTIISRSDFREKVWPLPAGDLLFVGRSTVSALAKHGIHTIGDIAGQSADNMRHWFGANGTRIWEYANGLDRSPVMRYNYSSPAKSIGHGITFTADLINNTEVYHGFLELSQNVSERLRESNSIATIISIHIKSNQLHSQQFQAQLPLPTQNWRDLSAAGYRLFTEKYKWQYPIRALTITAVGLIPANTPIQTNLFSDRSAYEKEDRLERTIFDIRNKFGKKAITLAGLMNNSKFPIGRLDEKYVLPGSALK